MKNICYLWGCGGRDWEGRGRERWVGEGESSREDEEGEVEVRGWLKAMGRARGVQEGGPRGKCPGQGWKTMKFRRGRREQRNE